jgi:HAMP domain-containing protein
MTKLNAGSAAKAGYYFNLKSWEVHPVPADGERLPGEAGQAWIAIPTVAALVLTPILGLTFLMFLPFIGFYLTIEAALQPVLRVFKHEATELAATMSPGWQPGEAHLTGKREGAGKAVESQGPPATELEKLAAEIEARRQEKK